MSPSPWREDEVIAALRQRLLPRGAVTDGFTGLDVLSDLPGAPERDTSGRRRAFVVFRWHHDLATYAVAFSLEPSDHTRPAALGVDTGTSVELLEDWVAEVGWWLMEELDTGLVRRAGRSLVEDVVLLDAHAGAVDVLPDGYYISGVYLGPGGADGAHLAHDGLDITTPRRLLAEQRSLTWLFAYVNNATGEPSVGHVVVSYGPPTSTAPATVSPARLDVLELVADTPDEVAAALAFHATRDAVERGAPSVTTNLEHPALADVGYQPDATGTRAVIWSDVKTPPLNPKPSH